jgi:hypothetical protein
MGLFKKKADPLAQRANTLNRRIAELEAEIARLSQNVTPGSAQRPSAEPSAPLPSRAPAAAPLPSHDPVFERMPPRPVDPRSAGEPAGREAVQLGLRRPVWSQWWRRLKAHFVDPPPANEKLVNYLAAGGIQGLRPLRFERRIARNRIIFVVVVLGILLWGLLVMFRHTR